MSSERREPRFRLRRWTPVVLGAVLAVALRAAVTFLSPTRRLGQLLRMDQQA
jgi:hypothetical protein